MNEPPSTPSGESLPEGAANGDTELVSERLCSDLVERWHRGERVPVEAYLRLHPQLEAAESAFELVLTEVILRQELGEAAPLEEYLWRFPQFADRLERHFALHAGLVVPSAPSTSTLHGGSPPAGNEIPHVPPALPGYEIIEPIGRGGMGIVYKARDENLGRYVALKLLRDDYARQADRMARFLREARTASALNHPGICTVHALGQQPDGHPFIVMEWVDGLTFRKMIANRPAQEEMTRLVAQAAQALAAAHTAGVVHRDIKPENIMLRFDGHVKVLDFGLARLLPESLLAGEANESDGGTLAGTVGYMSPEQTRGEPASSASDIFSLGIVAYELATGRHPFAAKSAHETIVAITSQAPLAPRRVNPLVTSEHENLLLQMLEKDPRRRPTAAEVAAALGRLAGGQASPSVVPLVTTRRTTVGREADRRALWSAFEVAENGGGLLLCVTGEPGIGKTTFVEDWLQELSSSGRAGAIGRGQCSERLAGTEAYLPVFEALESLLQGELGSLAARLMRDLAATWYAQVAPLQGDSSSEILALRAANSTQERMKREFLAFIAELGRHRPLVLFFDDLHWADASTVDILAWIGRRVTGLRLLIVTTYRPMEMLSGQNPFVPVQLELQRHGVCRELPLPFLTNADVESYLSLGFPDHAFPIDFATRLREKTEGNPLFLVELVRHLRDSGVIARLDGCWKLARSIPDFQQELPVSVRSLIHKQLLQLEKADHRLLAAGSVQGYEFDAGVVADVLGRNAADVEERLAELDRVHGLVRLVRELEFPDGTPTLRYRFVHVLYQNALYAGLPPTRRTEWSAAVAETLLNRHGRQSQLVANELALLFENARDWARAAEYFYLAAKYPLRLRAHRDAAALARRGLEMLERLPESTQRAQLEVRLQFALGISLQPFRGFTAPEVVEAYRRARALSQVEIDIASRSPLLWGLWSFHIFRAEHREALEIGEQLCRLAEGQTDPLIALPAHHSVGYSLMMVGDPVAAWSHLGLDLPAETQAVYGRDLTIPFRAHGAVVLWLLGRPDQAIARSRQAVAQAREKWDLYSLSIALFNAATAHQLRQEVEQTAGYAAALLTLAEEQAFPAWHAAGRVLEGWTVARQGDWAEGMARIRQGIADYRATGAAMIQPHFLGILAEALAIGGEIDEGLETIASALQLVDETGERYFEAELHRLRGQLLLQESENGDRRDEAEACYHKALLIAQAQEARGFELRAATSAALLARDLDRTAEVQRLLEPVCARFTEGFETPDWRAAATLLNELA